MSIVVSGPKKRDRVAKACFHCRKRKIKCDGFNPCGNCKNSNTPDCAYPAETKRRSKAKKDKVVKADSIAQLDDRLSKLEGLLVTLANKLGDDNEVSLSTSENRELDGQDDDTQNNDNQNVDVSLDSDGDGEYVRDTRVEHGYFVGVNHLGDKKSQTLEVFFGSHSVFHIFSAKSFQWMHQKLPKEDSHVFIPLENLHKIFDICFKSFTDIWHLSRLVDQERALLLQRGWLPDEMELVFDLLECYPKIFLAGNLCDLDHLWSLFEAYYRNKRINTTPSPNQTCNSSYRKTPYKFTNSELMIMNIVLALCISYVLDKRTQVTPSPGEKKDSVTPRLDRCSSSYLVDLQLKVYQSSIYYYNCVSIISEGIPTIQGILLMIIYNEVTFVKPKANYILTSIAMRYAQDIGLHRTETIRNLAPKDAKLRRKIWWYCESFDIEMCYRIGKPPLVNPLDVSTLRKLDFVDWSDGEFENRNGDYLDPAFLTYLKDTHGFLGYICYILNQVSQARLDAYYRLFSARSCDNSFEDSVNIVLDLNEKLFSIGSSLCPKLRPRFYNEPGFDDWNPFETIRDVEFGKDLLLSFYLTYFNLLACINRLISRVECTVEESQKPEALKIRNIAQDSARTILHLSYKVNTQETSFMCFNWFLFYQFGAFLDVITNCLNKPKSSSTFQDLNLLIDLAMKIFNFNFETGPKKLVSQPSSKLYNQRDTVFFAAWCVTLNIAIKIVEAQSSFRFFNTHPRLQATISFCQNLFPDLFKLNFNAPSTNSTRKSFSQSGTGLDTIVSTSDTLTSNSVMEQADSPWTIHSSMAPGPTGYFSATVPKYQNVQNPAQPNNNSSPGNFQTDPNFSRTFPLQSDLEFNETLEKLFSVETPNFFFDNSVGF